MCIVTEQVRCPSIFLPAARLASSLTFMSIITCCGPFSWIWLASDEATT